MPGAADENDFRIAHELGQLSANVREAIKRLDAGADRFASIDERLAAHTESDRKVAEQLREQAEQLRGQAARLTAIERRLRMRAGDDAKPRAEWTWFKRQMRNAAATVLSLLAIGAGGWFVQKIFHINLQPIIDKLGTPQ